MGRSFAPLGRITPTRINTLMTLCTGFSFHFPPSVDITVSFLYPSTGQNDHSLQLIKHAQCKKSKLDKNLFSLKLVSFYLLKVLLLIMFSRTFFMLTCWTILWHKVVVQESTTWPQFSFSSNLFNTVHRF